MTTRVDLHKALAAAGVVPMLGDFFRDIRYSLAEEDWIINEGRNEWLDYASRNGIRNTGKASTDCGYVAQEYITFNRRQHMRKARDFDSSIVDTGLAIGEFWFNSAIRMADHDIAIWVVNSNQPKVLFFEPDPAACRLITLSPDELSSSMVTLMRPQ